MGGWAGGAGGQTTAPCPLPRKCLLTLTLSPCLPAAYTLQPLACPSPPGPRAGAAAAACPKTVQIQDKTLQEFCKYFFAPPMLIREKNNHFVLDLSKYSISTL